MPYASIDAANKSGFPISAEGIALTLAQINKLAEIYDAIKKAGTAKNAFAVAWTAWKKLYKKTDDNWTEIKAAAIEFGTEQFMVAASRDAGIPDHAIQIKGRLIRLDKKNLAGWGVTAAAAGQIMAGIKGVPIRACSSQDPHKCDYDFDNRSHIGYGVRSWIEDGWICAAAAITDKDAAMKIEDGTWMPLGKGGWSVAGLPTKTGPDFEKTGLIAGYQPTGISLVFAPAIPAFEGSEFDMVVAAITNHRGINMAETPEGGGKDPVTYTQEQLDQKILDATSELDTKLKTLETEKADAAGAAKELSIDTIAKQKLEYDASLAKMTAEERASYDTKLAEMTPTVDVEKMIAAAVTKGQVDTLEAIEKARLTKEYGGLLTASVVLGAPYMTDNVVDPAKLSAKLAAVGEMKVAAITGLVDEAKMMVAAATPAQSAFDEMEVPGQPPGSGTQEAQDMAALAELREATGRL